MLTAKLKRLASFGLLMIMGGITADSVVPRDAAAVANVVVAAYAISGGVKGGRASGPREYTFDDLKQIISDYRDYFSFDNYDKPQQAVASLPSYAPNRMSAYGIMRSNMTIRPQNVPETKFPWNDQRLRVGQIATIKANGKTSGLIALFSTWTHDALIADPRNKLVLEAMDNEDGKRGVAIRNADRSWKQVIAYSVREVPGIYGQDVVDRAESLYKGIPYFPNFFTSDVGREGFAQKWSNKEDLSSMYCSKLVWNAYKNFKVYLDSNRTQNGRFAWFGLDEKFRDERRWGTPWIGVSPDDIYYSEKLSGDIVYQGLQYLDRPIAPETFSS